MQLPQSRKPIIVELCLFSFFCHPPGGRKDQVSPKGQFEAAKKSTLSKTITCKGACEKGPWRHPTEGQLVPRFSCLLLS